jgi:hypothetical protein
VPDITLEVDHIIPVAEGGKGSTDNLITACFDCNHGKGAKVLRRTPHGNDRIASADDLAERQLQLDAYLNAQRHREHSINVQVRYLQEYWLEHSGWSRSPETNSLRIFLKSFTLEEIVEVMDYCISKRMSDHRYFYKILHNKRREETTDGTQAND